MKPIYENAAKKVQIAIKKIFSIPSSTMIWIVPKVVYEAYWTQLSRKSDITCSMSKSATKLCNVNVAHIFSCDQILTYDFRASIWFSVSCRKYSLNIFYINNPFIPQSQKLIEFRWLNTLHGTGRVNQIEKIPHTGDTNSLDRCG